MAIKGKDFLKFASGDLTCVAPKVGWREKKKSSRKVGEIWEDTTGKKWIQKDGYVSSYNEKAELIKKQTKRICKTCGQDIDFGHRNDSAFWNRTGNCMNCQTHYESDLRIMGKYKIYEETKVTENQISHLNEIKSTIKDLFSKIEVKEDTRMFEIVGLNNSLLHEETWDRLDHNQLKSEYKKDYKMVVKQIYILKKKLTDLLSEH